MTRSWRALSVGVFAAGCIAVGVPAQAAYPDHPVHIVVGFTAGGAADIITRLVAQKLQDKWGQSVVVDNKAGADGEIAADYVAHSPADGYTLMESSQAFMLALPDVKQNYDPIKSFAPVIQMAAHPDILLINPAFTTISSVPDLINTAKANPGRLNFGSGGKSTPAYMNMALLMKVAGISMTSIAYKSTSPAVVALVGGEIQTLYAGPGETAGYVKSGKLKALAISGSVPAPFMPGVPNIGPASGYAKDFDVDVDAWAGIFAPSGTPKDIITKIHDDIAEAVKSSEVEKKLTDQGYITIANSSEQFTSYLPDALTKLKALIASIDWK